MEDSGDVPSTLQGRRDRKDYLAAATAAEDIDDVRAATDYLKLALDFGWDPAIASRLSESLLHCGRIDDAGKIMDRLIAELPCNSRNLLILAGIRIGQKKLREADEILASVTPSPQNTDFLLWVRIERAFADEKFDEGVRLFEEALETYPERDWSTIYLALGGKLEAVGNYEVALIQYEKGLKVDPDNVNLLANYGKLLMHLGRRSRASEVLSRARFLAPHHSEVISHSYTLFFQAGEKEKAAEQARLYAKYFPDMEGSHLTAAWSFYELRLYEEACESARRLLAINKDSVAGHRILAKALFRQGNWREGWKVLKRFLVLPEQSK